MKEWPVCTKKLDLRKIRWVNTDSEPIWADSRYPFTGRCLARRAGAGGYLKPFVQVEHACGLSLRSLAWLM
jgi:hypothetical protein